MKFTHLHVHSHYSLLDGLARIDQLVKRASDLGFEALALTDHGVMYGAIEFYQKARKAGIKPIIGCEIYIANENLHQKRPGIDDRRHHLTVLAKNYAGYKNLMQIVTQSHLKGFYYKPRADHELLRKYAAGLIALSGCLNGEIPKAILSRDFTRAQTLIREYQEIFGKENFYLELGAHPNIPEQEIVNGALMELSARTGTKIVGVNDIHYARPEDAEAQDILVSVQTGNRIDDENRLTMKADDFSMKSTQEMADFFSHAPEAISSTQEIAEAIDIEIPMGKILLPTFPVPDGLTDSSYLGKLAERGLDKRYGQNIASSDEPDAAKIMERLSYEMEVIKQTGFTPYFLIVEDLVSWARKNGVLVGPGRGSAAGSLVSYLLGITNVDPLKYNLLFERFLNPERIDMPDIDLDFSDKRRDEVVEYAANKYGRDHVAQIITFGTMAARAALRDTGRATGVPYSFCDQLAKLIPFHMGLREALEKVDEFKRIYQSRDDAKKLIDQAMKLEGVARHASTHACGVVIAPEPLTEYVPLQLATRSGGRNSGNGEENNKVVVTQYEMHAIEDLGLLKMDFLGLRNLTIIEDAIKLIQKNHGLNVDIDSIPLNDAETFRIFKEGKTSGVFQFESAGMKRYLKDLKPASIDDLTAMVSLYRPGPMELIPSFIARKHGREKISYLHPKLETILAPTYGIGVYQEQMMQIARDLAGFTLPEADTLRKAIGKKIRSLLEEQKEKLLSGMVQHRIESRTAQAIWEMFPPFARYGFNKSHGVCYALIAYQTAYLKAHWPAEFMAALMTAEGFEIERVAFLVDETRALGIQILPPSINASNATFTVSSPRQIRFGLGSVKNVGSNIVEAIVNAREGGEFTSIDNFIERVQHKDLNRKSMESLVKCGALDEIGERSQLIANMERVLDYARDIQKQKARAQPSLFGADEKSMRSFLRLEPAPPAEKKERLSWEKELLGLYISEHPLDEYKTFFQNKVVPVSSLAEHPKDTVVAIGGLVSAVERIITKAGSPMLFVKLEDLTGKTEVLVFPRLLEKNTGIWQQDKILLVKGRLSRDRDIPKVLCDEVTEIA